jgi:hypothetical protein
LTLNFEERADAVTRAVSVVPKPPAVIRSEWMSR